MKIFPTKLKNSLLLFLLAFSLNVFSKPVAQVVEIKGQAFSLNENGKTRLLILNDHLEEREEVLVEEGGSVTLNDYYDSTYHLIGGSHIKFFDQSAQLKNGKAWIQGKNEKYNLNLTTANALIEFGKSEFIITFNQTTSKSQLLNINGDTQFSNILNHDFKQSMGLGQFSFIDPKVDNGLPRLPTRVGLTSLNSALSEFKGLPEEIKQEKMIFDSTPVRSIASVAEETNTKKGKIIFIQTNRLPASVEEGAALNYFESMKAKPKMESKKPALPESPIRFYGIVETAAINSKINESNTKKERSPASVPSVQLSFDSPKIESTALTEDEFMQSLEKHEKDQPKYSKELENLIDDLKSY